jgi:hypothetical protein
VARILLLAVVLALPGGTAWAVIHTAPVLVTRVDDNIYAVRETQASNQGGPQMFARTQDCGHKSEEESAWLLIDQDADTAVLAFGEHDGCRIISAAEDRGSVLGQGNAGDNRAKRFDAWAAKTLEATLRARHPEAADQVVKDVVQLNTSGKVTPDPKLTYQQYVDKLYSLASLLQVERNFRARHPELTPELERDIVALGTSGEVVPTANETPDAFLERLYTLVLARHAPK